MDLDELKKALDEGNIFTGADKLNEISKNADKINSLSDKKREDIFEKRDSRLVDEWKDVNFEEKKKLIEDDNKKFELRNKSNKNEMDLAQIEYLKNEIHIFEEYINNLLEEVSNKKRQIDNHQIEIDEIKNNISKLKNK